MASTEHPPYLNSLAGRKTGSARIQHYLEIDEISYILYNFTAIVREPNFENCLDLIFAAPPCEKVIIVPDTNYITSAIRKFMLDMPSPGSFQNIGLLI